ncbi:MAG: pilus assembly protein CpaC [Alphaproteobacteria bacterium]|jgi:pilus assembly protein CpaC
MRTTTTKVICSVLASAATFAMTSALPGGTNEAIAGSRSSKGAPVAASSHRSVFTVRNSNQLPMTKGLTVALNKSLLIELPRELRDVVVSDPATLDVVVQSSNRAYLIGKKYGQANAFFFDAHGERILTLEIQVERDTSVLDALYHRLMAGSNITTEVINDTLILTGSVRNPSDATKAVEIARRFAVSTKPGSNTVSELKVINMLAVDGEEQVQLRVTIAEVQRQLLKQFGINLGAIVNSGNFSTSILSQNALPLTAAAGLGALPIPGITPATNALANYALGPTANTFGNSGVSGGWASGGNNISHAIRALERNGLVRTLAEPNLTAVSGETAKFLAGGEYPIPIVDGNGALAVRFKEFGVALAFTPIVMSEGRISLKIETEVSELTTEGSVSLSGIQIPALKKRQAKSTVELPSGGSIALAGLMSNDTRQNVDGMPGLKDLPVLGTLFRSRDFIKQETELVVIVTPYLVKPIARNKLGRPSDGLAAATDMKANFLGHLNRIYGKGSTVSAGSTKDFGFIVE